ncbi:hypothetical protein [Streptomyces sasae]|uniref:hypothetical protein n=1 Tax=Streptomyces sasae TaxID=1266772 RepID=UPI00292E4517|nr:hypothetical protein [Streptomyces sasae]
MKRRTSPVAVAVAVTAALLLTACGGGDGNSRSSEKIAAADSGSNKASSSPSASDAVAGIDRPAMPFPSDFDMVFDIAKPSDAKEAAALGDAENFVRAINYGIVRQDPEDAAYKFYSTVGSTAQSYAKTQIKQYLDGGWTVTGVQRYSRGKVDLAADGKRASVSFCDDDSKFYGKEVKSKKILKTSPSDKDYYYFEVVMAASMEAKGLWTAENVKVQTKAIQCKG